MNKKVILSLVIGIFVFGYLTLPVSAQDSPSPSGGVQQTRMANLQQRARAEITARLDSLNKTLATLNSVKKISDSDKAALVTQVQAQISSLQALQTKIQGDTDLPTLQTDVKSISTAFRIYWLFLPKIHILAASDRINDVAALMQNLVNKLQSRITAGGSAAASLQPTLEDAKAKISDAKTQAANAVNLVTALQPDKGDNNVLQSNVAALKSARTDIQTAYQDLRVAHQDFKSIVQALKGLQPSPHPSATP